MPYGTIKVDTVTFTNDGVDKSVTISGLVQNPTFSGNVTVTGTVSGNTIQGQTVSGGVVTITSGVFALGSASNPSISFSGDANSGLYSPGADLVAISTSGTGRLFVDASGRVGINTTNPLSTLDVKFDTSPATDNGSGINVLRVVSNEVTAANVGGGISFLSRHGGSDYSARAQIVGRKDNATSNDFGGYLQFCVNNAGGSMAERLRITSTGLVGIGTTSPGYLLQVSDKFAVDNSNTFGRIYLQRQTGTSLTAMYIQGADQANTASDLAIVNTSGGGSAIEIAGGTSLAAIKFFTNGATTERARIDFSGRFLVGTSTAQGGAKLQVQDGEVFLRRSLSNASINAAGIDLGFVDFGNQDGGVGAQILAEADAAWGTNDYPGRLVFSTTADGASTPTERMRIKANGATCIGTSTEGTMSGDTVVAIGPNIGIISKSASGVATSGTVDININTGGGGYQGFLVVSNTDASNGSVRTHTTFSVFGRGTDSSIQQIATDNGTTSGASFTVTTPTNGVIRVTNTSAGSRTVHIQFFGGTSF